MDKELKTLRLRQLNAGKISPADFIRSLTAPDHGNEIPKNWPDGPQVEIPLTTDEALVYLDYPLNKAAKLFTDENEFRLPVGLLREPRFKSLPADADVRLKVPAPGISIPDLLLYAGPMNFRREMSERDFIYD